MKIKPAKHSGEVVMELGRDDAPLLNAATISPFRLTNILVPIDFSDCSKKALQYALPLAKQHGAAITLLYVVPNPPYTSGEYGFVDYGPIDASMRENATKELTALALEVAQGEIPADTEVRTGSAAVEIVELAKTLPADLIVVSTHGHSGLKHVLLGSVAEHVVRHAPCPVLVVREREREFVKA
jgi:universal stress protein A